MKALIVSNFDGPGQVRVEEVPDPVPGPDQVLIEVKASGLTFPDLLHTRGQYQTRPELPFVLGTEAAGTVISAPRNSGFDVGQRVAALTSIGGHAQLVAVDKSMVLPLPDEVDFAEGAALVMNYLTVFYALRDRVRLQPGDTVLVHGAAGGVGSAAIQVAVALGATVIAVVSSPEKGELATRAGARHVIGPDGFLGKVKELTNGRGVDAVIDPVGGDRMLDSIRSLAGGGAVVILGFTSGEIPKVGINRVLLANISLIGIHWGPWIEADPSRLRRQWDDLLPLIRSGALKPTISRRLTLEQGAEGLTEIDERRVVGRLVLEP